jgi:hypothetical protein
MKQVARQSFLTIRLSNTLSCDVSRNKRLISKGTLCPRYVGVESALLTWAAQSAEEDAALAVTLATYCVDAEEWAVARAELAARGKAEE